MAAVDQHDLAGLVGNDGDGDRGNLGAGKGLGKHLGWLNLIEKTAVAEIVDLNDLCRPREDDADVVDLRALGKNGVFFVKRLHPGAETGEHPLKILVPNAVEERTFSQNRKIFFQFFLLLLKIQQKSCSYYTIIYSENQEEKNKKPQAF